MPPSSRHATASKRGASRVASDVALDRAVDRKHGAVVEDAAGGEPFEQRHSVPSLLAESEPACRVPREVEGMLLRRRMRGRR